MLCHLLRGPSQLGSEGGGQLAILEALRLTANSAGGFSGKHLPSQPTQLPSISRRPPCHPFGPQLPYSLGTLPQPVTPIPKFVPGNCTLRSECKPIFLKEMTLGFEKVRIPGILKNSPNHNLEDIPNVFHTMYSLLWKTKMICLTNRKYLVW